MFRLQGGHETHVPRLQPRQDRFARRVEVTNLEELHGSSELGDGVDQVGRTRTARGCGLEIAQLGPHRVDPVCGEGDCSFVCEPPFVQTLKCDELDQSGSGQ